MKTNHLPYLGCPVAIMGFEIRCNLSKRPGPQVTIHSIVPYIHEVSPFKFRFQVHIYAHFKNARERLPGCLSSPHCVCAFTRIAEPTFGKIKRRLQIFQMKIKILPSSKCNNRGERKTHASTLFLSSYKAE